MYVVVDWHTYTNGRRGIFLVTVYVVLDVVAYGSL